MKMGAVKAKFHVWTYINISPYFPNLLTDLAEIRSILSQMNPVHTLHAYFFWGAF
jgi:hypothetical protein